MNRPIIQDQRQGHYEMTAKIKRSQGNGEPSPNLSPREPSPNHSPPPPNQVGSPSPPADRKQVTTLDAKKLEARRASKRAYAKKSRLRQKIIRQEQVSLKNENEHLRGQLDAATREIQQLRSMMAAEQRVTLDRNRSLQRLLEQYMEQRAQEQMRGLATTKKPIPPLLQLASVAASDPSLRPYSALDHSQGLTQRSRDAINGYSTRIETSLPANHPSGEPLLSRSVLESAGGREAISRGPGFPHLSAEKADTRISDFNLIHRRSTGMEANQRASAAASYIPSYEQSPAPSRSLVLNGGVGQEATRRDTTTLQGPSLDAKAAQDGVPMDTQIQYLRQELEALKKKFQRDPAGSSSPRH